MSARQEIDVAIGQFVNRTAPDFAPLEISPTDPLAHSFENLQQQYDLKIGTVKNGSKKTYWMRVNVYKSNGRWQVSRV